MANTAVMSAATSTPMRKTAGRRKRSERSMRSYDARAAFGSVETL
jgi:hypothetical protein